MKAKVFILPPSFRLFSSGGKQMFEEEREEEEEKEELSLWYSMVDLTGLRTDML